MTPVNVESAWEAFRRRKYLTTPKFRYRPLPHDPDLLLRRLYNLPIEKIEDPAVAQLFRLKRSELRRQATILSSRDTIQALFGTLGLYSAPDKELVKTAKRILRTPTGEAAQRKRRTVDAKEFARFARIEANRYRKNYPYFNLPIEIRDDIHRGLMVSHGRLLIGSRFRTREQRMDALLQHEVGTHVVTYLNGQQQKFNILRVGLPNYEELQEGLAVLAEYLVDGLDLERLRVLAARVVVAQQFHQGRSFSNCFSTLVESYGFTTRSAFTITLRIFRGGGMLKDAVYLRGLSKLLTHLGSGGKIEELYVGKLSLNTLGIIRELMWRGIVAEASVYPEFLRRPKAVERLNLLSDLKDPISGLLASARRRLL
jgi:uncharacterized protein (TIGR02421 family)